MTIVGQYNPTTHHQSTGVLTMLLWTLVGESARIGGSPRDFFGGCMASHTLPGVEKPMKIAKWIGGRAAKLKCRDSSQKTAV